MFYIFKCRTWSGTLHYKARRHAHTTKVQVQPTNLHILRSNAGHDLVHYITKQEHLHTQQKFISSAN